MVKDYTFAGMLEVLLDDEMKNPFCPFRATDEGCDRPEEWVVYYDVPAAFFVNGGRV